MNDADGQLVRRCQAGDEEAFRALHDAHAGRVRAYLLRSGFSQPDADDLTQDVFVRVVKSLHTFDASRGSLRTWLGTIARNVARKRWARRAHVATFDAELAEEMFADDPDPRDTPEARQEQQALAGCIEALPAEAARLVRLRYVDGRTTRGIAEAMGLAEATVRARLKDALRRLQQCLAEKGILQ